ncbi:hypothetical protein AXF42_Ash001771 [Apostasia shenzhenica]|uniref:Uncharacterized protein n=1 Tax=Apostasia shenzhenica TaxID=1088818 RepID=A0A2I0AB71_9ASPA|nr:hypothetical protein AXF42_Ash001771 [Apostasia shenzhenica]
MDVQESQKPARPKGVAKTLNAAGCIRSSVTEHFVPAVAAVDQSNLPWENRAVCSSTGGAEAAGIAGTKGSNFKPETGATYTSPTAVSAGISAQNRAEGAGSVRNSSTNETEGLISSHCKEEDAQLLTSSPSQHASLPAHNRANASDVLTSAFDKFLRKSGSSSCTER